MPLGRPLPDAFYHLVTNDNVHCQTPLKTPNVTYLAVKDASWKIWLRIVDYSCDSPTGDSVHFPAVLSNYNGMTAYICREFIPTTAFLVSP